MDLQQMARKVLVGGMENDKEQIVERGRPRDRGVQPQPGGQLQRAAPRFE
ncbi:hypothetical protein [Rugamonas aquatica]|nr:hypothetical protein [Rugamonas aquatica]